MLLSYPCPIDWDSMEGDDYKRYCNQCSLNVYNISSLSREEAERFLEEEEGVCIRFYQRPDGSVKTRDCASFLHRTREKYTLIKKSLLVASSVFLSFIIGVFKPVDSATAEADDCVKTKWHGNNRDFDLHALDGLSGRPFSSDVRSLVESLLNFNRFNTLPSDQPPALKKILRDIEKTRTIRPDHIEALKSYFKETGNEEDYFGSRVLEATLAVENPSLSTKKKDEVVLNFEKLRLSKLDNLFSEAMELYKAGQRQLALERLEYFMNVASIGQPILENDISLPDKFEKWKCPKAGLKEVTPKYVLFIAKKEQLDGAISLISEVVGESLSRDSELLLRRLRFAELQKQNDLSANSSLKKKMESLEEELDFIESTSFFPSLYLAKLASFKVEDNGPESYFYNVIRVFEPVEKVAGKSIEQEMFRFSSYSPIYRKFERNKSNPYDLSRFKSLQKSGAKFLVFCGSNSFAAGYVRSVKVFQATPSLVDLSKKHFLYSR